MRYLTYSIDTPSYVAQWYNSLDYADAEDVDVKTDQAVSLDDVLLEQGVSITGTVTDADFAPIAEVRVYAYKEGDRDNWVASAIITEPDTNYTLSGLAPGINYKIYFMADGYISEWYDDKRGSVESVPAGAADVLSGTTDIDTVLNKRVSLVPVYYLLLLK
ncbi:MAG: carboxypeptidase-like regulatory domain-containing protein [Candidatus Electrothrix sp. YB6]